MRLAALVAVSALAAACSQSVGGQAESPGSPTPAPTATSPAASPQAPSTPTPAAAAPIDEVIDFIEAGTPVDPGSFHVAFRDGVTTRLGDAVAFVAPSGPPHSTTQCITTTGPLTCLLDPTAPAPRPAQAEGVWKPGWTEFTGTTLSVGALRGDPGPFAAGTGTELAAGQSLAFGDNRCRSDSSGLYCVNYAHRAAVRIAAAGVVPFGCLAALAPPPESAALYGC
ncbi:hypothetical protein FHR72_004521 [Mycolicibacterium iranicum]|uniref:LppI n=1 Tax=Mycolicibacterium iranicum TaxID=912594 RepID=A0A839QE08_MYCIR|nr:hypothetical protein [Mycolicibacterium iranicum]MBB2993014.1 hypothetical protein [Mycolicibacterium iranicum]